MKGERVMVACGIWSGGIIGPFFFDDTLICSHENEHKLTTVNKESYMDMLENHFWPAYQAIPELHGGYFMHDGAPSHTSGVVTTWMDNHFENRWLGLDGPIAWPPRSPDLTPLDFFLWGHTKDKVYSRRPRNRQELKNFIIAAITSITPEMCHNSCCTEFVRRLDECIKNGGRQILH